MKLSEINPKTLVDEFIASISKREISLYSIRDNCGPAAIDFISWLKTKGINAHRVQGYFKADSVVFDKADFTKEMKAEFIKDGGNFNSSKDRKEWIDNSKYSEEWKEIPHYWVKIEGSSKIFDPSGELQFIKSGLAKDLNPTRYIEKK